MKTIHATLALTAFAAATVAFATGFTGPSEPACQGTDCDCLAPDVCGDREVVCPPGPDCFMPDHCFDQAVTCPPCADSPPAE